MPRRIILCLLLCASTCVAAADEHVGGTPASGTAPATSPSGDAAKQQDRRLVADTKVNDAKVDAPAVAGDGTAPGGDVKMSGMSILGNEDAPKSLVLVPWKSSQLGDMPSVSRLLDSTTQPVDKEVFLRELAYYEFKSGPGERGESSEHPVEK